MGNEQNKLDMWLVTNQKNFPAEKMPLIQEKLAQMPEEKHNLVYAIDLKDPTTIFIGSFFLAIDRFMLGQVGLGILKILTLGGLWIWMIADWITAKSRARQYNFNKLQEITGQFGSENKAEENNT